METAATWRPAWYLVTTPASTLAWIKRLRYTTAGLYAVVAVVAYVVPQLELPLRQVAPLIGATAFFHLAVAWRIGRGVPLRPLVALAFAVDAMLLTGLLELSGGPSNPFSVVYAVQIALVAALLGRRWAYPALGWVAVCYGVLISWHLHELVPPHHRLIDFPTHLFTVWLTIAVGAELIARFIHEASTIVARRQAEVDEMRQRAARAEHAVSLTTLAAGAAHELSTPLGTIALASRELERALGEAQIPAVLRDDARLIREQVDRCQVILDEMSGRAGGVTAGAAEPVDLVAVFEEVRRRLPPAQARHLILDVRPDLPPLIVPRAGLIQVLLSLIKNAFDATAATAPVTIAACRAGLRLRLIVRDHGPGMSEEVLRRAGEPFFTTKDPGHGRGLGLFLAQMFAERCGGRLELSSDSGTIAVLDLPVSAEAPAGELNPAIDTDAEAYLALKGRQAEVRT